MIRTTLKSSLMALVALSFISFNSHAAIIIQDIFLDITFADIGNEFGVTTGDSALLASVSFDTTSVSGATISPIDNPSFAISLNFGSLSLTQFDDIFAEGVLDPLAPELGLSNLFYIFDNGFEFVSLLGTDFFAFDSQFLTIDGTLRFAQAVANTPVSEPHMAALMLVMGVFLVARKRLV